MKSSRKLAQGTASALAVLVAGGAFSCARKDPAAESTAVTPLPSPSPSAPGAGAQTAAETTEKRDLSPVLAGVQRSCNDICERSRELHCKNASECMKHCMGMGSLTPCAESMTSFYKCLVGQPAKNWECDEDGIAAIREGFCDKEQESAVACMEAKMQP